MTILGIDIGGTGIKAGIVDTATGVLISERLRMATPRPVTPGAVAGALKQVIERFEWKGLVGAGFPAAIHKGEVMNASNIDPSFIGLPVSQYFSEVCGMPLYVLNDADAAGLAEVRFGAGKDVRGVVLVVTIGTGLGTALFSSGHLLPNAELGHVLLSNGMVAERYASEAVRVSRELSWREWGGRLNQYLSTMEKLLWPDLIILGGGVSARLNKFSHMISIKTPVVAAQFLNQAGIIGAALYASERGAQD